MKRNKLLTLALVFAALLLSCNFYYDVMESVGLDDEVIEEEDYVAESGEGEAEVAPPDTEEMEEEAPPEVEPPSSEPVPVSGINTKMDLWASGQTVLRGANIWQAIVVLDLDGPDFKGDGPVGPPFSQEDFDRLAALGANYVTLSVPGVFTEVPPFEPDMEIVAYLDDLLEKIANADMFATIAFRTGPGRAEWGLCCAGDEYFDGYFNDTLWEDPAARDAWAEMWQYTAERYRDNPIVAGYKLMVEPNAADLLLGIWEPEDFYPEYAGSAFDWNALYPSMVEAIREVDPETPILVGGMSYSRVGWLPYLEVVDAPNMVYVVHFYEPPNYCFQEAPGDEYSYPGGGELNRAAIDELLSGVDDFSAQHGVPMAVDEFGVWRWVDGAEVYMNDVMGLFEEHGLNHSLWEWSTSWRPFEEKITQMNFRLGPDPDSTQDTPNALMDVITSYWSRNTVRPSNVPWGPGQ